MIYKLCILHRPRVRACVLAVGDDEFDAGALSEVANGWTHVVHGHALGITWMGVRLWFPCAAVSCLSVSAQLVLLRSQSAGELFGSRVNNATHTSSDALPSVNNVVRCSSMLPTHAHAFSTLVTQPLNTATTLRGCKVHGCQHPRSQR